MNREQKIVALAQSISLVDGLVNPPKGGKYYRYAEAALDIMDSLDTITVVVLE